MHNRGNLNTGTRRGSLKTGKHNPFLSTENCMRSAEIVFRLLLMTPEAIQIYAKAQVFVSLYYGNLIINE